MNPSQPTSSHDGNQTPPNDQAVLIGLIREIVMIASTRVLTDGDRLLTAEELHANAQESLDAIAHECDLVLADYDLKDLRAASEKWSAWRKAKGKTTLKEPNG